jgi:hypothetical protein
MKNKIGLPFSLLNTHFNFKMNKSISKMEERSSFELPNFLTVVNFYVSMCSMKNFLEK